MIKILLLTLTTMCLFIQTAHATEEVVTGTLPNSSLSSSEKIFSAGLAGGAFDYADANERGVTVGVQFDFRTQHFIGVGLDLSQYHSPSTANRFDVDRMILFFNTKVFPFGSASYLKFWHVGLGFGPVAETLSGRTQLKFGSRIYLGTDVPISKLENGQQKFTIGGRIGYFTIIDSYENALNAEGILKYWF